MEVLELDFRILDDPLLRRQQGKTKYMIQTNDL